VNYYFNGGVDFVLTSEGLRVKHHPARPPSEVFGKIVVQLLYQVISNLVQISDVQIRTGVSS